MVVSLGSHKRGTTSVGGQGERLINSSFLTERRALLIWTQVRLVPRQKRRRVEGCSKGPSLESRDDGIASHQP